MKSKICIAALLLALIHAAYAQAPKVKPVQQKSLAKSDWVLIKSVDKMTDKKVCAMSYTKNPAIWLETDISIMVSYAHRGGLKGYQYRIGDQKASDFILAAGAEKASDSFQLWNFDSTKLFEAKKVFVRAVTVLDRVIEDEIDLTHIDDARRQLAECMESK